MNEKTKASALVIDDIFHRHFPHVGDRPPSRPSAHPPALPPVRPPLTSFHFPSQLQGSDPETVHYKQYPQVNMLH